MFPNIKVDVTSVSTYIWIMVIAAVFSIFSLVYNPAFIYFGFLTFVYGVVAHVVPKSFTSYPKVVVILEVMITIVWILFISNLV